MCELYSQFLGFFLAWALKPLYVAIALVTTWEQHVTRESMFLPPLRKTKEGVLLVGQSGITRCSGQPTLINTVLSVAQLSTQQINAST